MDWLSASHAADCVCSSELKGILFAPLLRLMAQNTCHEDMQCYLKHDMIFLSRITYDLTTIFAMGIGSWCAALAFKATMMTADLLSTYRTYVPLSPAAAASIAAALQDLARQGVNPSAADVMQSSAALKGSLAAPSFTVNADASTHSLPAAVSLPIEAALEELDPNSEDFSEEEPGDGLQEGTLQGLQEQIGSIQPAVSEQQAIQTLAGEHIQACIEHAHAADVIFQGACSFQLLAGSCRDDCPESQSHLFMWTCHWWANSRGMVCRRCGMHFCGCHRHLPQRSRAHRRIR